MSSLILLAALLAPTQASSPPATDEARPVDALVHACHPLAVAKSYRFTMTTESEGGGGGRGGFGGGGEPGVVTGTVAKDMPTHLATEQGELFLLGEKIAMLDEEGNWSAPPERGSGGGRGEGGPAGGPGGERGERGERGEGRRGGRGGPARMLRSFQAPHTLVTDLDRFVTDVVRNENENGEVVYVGKLTDDAITQLGGSGGRRGGFGGRGGDVDMQQSGTFSVTLDPQGALREIAYSVRMQAVFGDREIDRTTLKRIALADLDTATVEVPEGAAMVLEYEPKVAEKKDDWF